jgi:hypothetical protein
VIPVAGNPIGRTVTSSAPKYHRRWLETQGTRKSSVAAAEGLTACRNSDRLRPSQGPPAVESLAYDGRYRDRRHCRPKLVTGRGSGLGPAVGPGPSGPGRRQGHYGIHHRVDHRCGLRRGVADRNSSPGIPLGASRTGGRCRRALSPLLHSRPMRPCDRHPVDGHA